MPPTNYLLLTANQEPCNKNKFLTKNVQKFSGKKNQENVPLAGKKDKTESATGGGRRAREETVK